jgi:hypothetical protein
LCLHHKASQTAVSSNQAADYPLMRRRKRRQTRTYDRPYRRLHVRLSRNLRGVGCSAVPVVSQSDGQPNRIFIHRCAGTSFRFCREPALQTMLSHVLSQALASVLTIGDAGTSHSHGSGQSRPTRRMQV